jgi:hypothetical protein
MNQDFILPLGIRLEDLVAVGAALSAILTFAAIWFGAIERAPSSRRVKELAMRREQLKAGTMTTSRRRNRQGSTNFMRQFVMSMNLQRSQRAELITRKLAQAGWRSNDALIRYLFFKACRRLRRHRRGVFLRTQRVRICRRSLVLRRSRRRDAGLRRSRYLREERDRQAPLGPLPRACRMRST